MRSDSSQNTSDAYGFAGGESDGDDKIRKIHKMLIGRYPYAILLAFVGLLAGGVGGWFAFTPTFESKATLRIEQYQIDVVSGQQEVIKSIESYIKEQCTTITTTSMLLEAMKNHNWSTLGRDESLSDFAEMVKTLYTGRGTDRETFHITFTHSDKEVAAQGLTAVLSVYKKSYDERYEKEWSEKQKALNETLSDIQVEIDALSEKINARTNGQGLEAIKAEYAQTNERRLQLQQQLEQVEVMLTTLENGEGTQPDQINESPEVLIQRIAEVDPRMAALVAQRDDLEIELQAVMGKYGELHTQVISRKRNIKVIKDAIEDRRLNFDLSLLPDPSPLTPGFGDPAELRKRKAAYERELKSREALLADLNDAITAVGELGLKLSAAQRSQAQTRDAYDKLVRDDPARGRLKVVTGGSVPDKPANFSQMKQLAVLGGMLGAMMGFGVILLFAARDKRLRTSDDARMGSGLGDLLGVLPTLPDDLADPDQAAIAAHCVHHIRTLLQVGHGDEQRRVIAVTSPAAGTGKTSLCLALGLSFAESGDRTLLIDCDLFGAQLSARVNAIVRRHIGQILHQQGRITAQQIDAALQLSETEGIKIGEALVKMGIATDEIIAEALEAQAQTRLGVLNVVGGDDMMSCIGGAGFQNLSILPVGDAQPHDAGKLSPHSIRRMIAETSRHFDTVIIDTGPVPASLEASVVAAESDGVVLTVSRGEQRPMAVKARMHLESIGARVAGVVFNRATATDVDPYSYRPRSISGDRSLAVALPRHAAGRNDPRMAGYGPIAKAVSLYTDGDEEHDGSGNGQSGGNGAAAPVEIDQEKGGFVIEDD